MQPKSIPRSAWAALGLLASALAAAAQGVAPSAGPWLEAPAHVTLFAPPAARAAYRAFTTPRALDDVLQDLTADPALLQPPGAWTARAVAPLDAFGRGGVFDRPRVARLYGSRQPRIARGPRVDDGRVGESWLLVSPYPDASLSRLEPGTLLIVLRLTDP